MKKTQETPFTITRRRLGNGRCRLRVAVISDLHARQCPGLPEAVHSLQPDCILLPGDILECIRMDNAEARLRELDEEAASRWEKYSGRILVWADGLLHKLRGVPQTDKENANSYAFLRSMAEIAPTYYGMGNHEKYMLPREHRQVEATGAIYLENGYVEQVIAGVKLRVGCYTGEKHADWLEAFCGGEPNVLRLLLCHRPELAVRHLRGLSVDGIFSVMPTEGSGG